MLGFNYVYGYSQKGRNTWEGENCGLFTGGQSRITATISDLKVGVVRNARQILVVRLIIG